ncbi:heme-degrading domain-containing protein [Aurantimonas sp. E1-2-R+4]|uniref:heme-degrading domain-containing protein n=1 Tax=Aurantimonas sp. E1-2-R+4 TaxID=3113714 RepID=UPI002F940F7B
MAAMDSDELARVIEEESALLFENFDEAVAFSLGSSMQARALAQGARIVIDIRLWDRPLFYAALPGSTGSNPEWARRKINVVRLFHKSSYRMALEQRREDRTFPPRYGLDVSDYVLAGGGFPIRVRSAGVIGAIAVSGLAEHEDHDMIVAAIGKFVGG